MREHYPQAKVAIAGFCMGGTIAVYRTMARSETYSAAAVWYGSLTAIDPAKVDVPVVASYGEDDKGIPLEDVEKFRTGISVPHDIKVYANAEHAFFDQEGAAYNEAAAEDSWQRHVTFLSKYLSP